MNSLSAAQFKPNLLTINMSSTSVISKKDYQKILQDANFAPKSYREIADALMQNGVKQMFHAVVHEEDFVKFFTIPHMKIFWVCRCHHVADDGSSAREHLHALVQYEHATHEGELQITLIIICFEVIMFDFVSSIQT